MDRLRVVCVLFLCGIASVSIATDLVIESLDGNGQLIFNEVPNVSTYRVEQASSLGGSWGFFTNIPPSGTGTITSSIPLAASAQFFRVVAELEPTPEGMALIPAGSFQMGDTFGEGYSSELPVHSVYVSGFYVGKYEVTNDEMVEVMQWAHDNGKLIVSSSSITNAQGNQQKLLDLDDVGCRITWDGSTFGIKSEKGSGYPCFEVSWYGSAAYCNYRSEMEERTPCYNLSDWSCDFSANGYRLPTEAEWEKAARGGLNGKRFDWGDTINHNYANYWANGSAYPYDTSPYTTYTFHPSYADGDVPYSNPVGSFAPNGHGLYDMVGNMWEWCSDWYDGEYYASSPSSNPRGASTGLNRVMRGGCWAHNAKSCRSAGRLGGSPSDSRYFIGFRAALPAKP
ncbi:MAG: hypothetical protein DRP64_08875 [Verrucomicrobia bacterium]|nr:MAG: hypothetical protein DRP64_08875 [Verrucomicrobiota bacterium]